MTADLTDAELRVGRVRERSLDLAMQTAAIGEDAMAILARAQLYEEYTWPRASCDTQPKAGDVEQAPLVSGAVGEAETPKA